MRKMLLTLLLCVLALPLAAQEKMQGPPKIIEIIRESVKPGKAYVHTAHEAQWTRAMVNAKFDTPMLAMTATTGPNEAWFLEGYESFAAFEKDSERLAKNASMRSIMETNTARESDYVEESRTMLARYRDDLSYNPNFNLGEYRYFMVNTIRTRTGQDVADFYKPLNEARKSANMEQHFAMYQVISGAPGGTFLVFRPLKSLAEMDAPPNTAMQDATRDLHLGDIAGKVFQNTESRIYEFSPQMSAMPAEVVAANPAFWKPKPMMMKAEVPAAKKEPEKTPDKK